MGQVLKLRFRWSTSGGWKWFKREYIRWKTPHEKGIEKNKGKKDCNNLNHPSVQEGSSYTGLASSNWKYSDICILYLCSIVMQHNANHCPTYSDLVIWLILYKFIVLGSLGQELIRFGLGPQIVTLQLAPSMGRTCASMSAMVNHGGIRSTLSRSTPNGACRFTMAGQFP